MTQFQAQPRQAIGLTVAGVILLAAAAAMWSNVCSIDGRTDSPTCAWVSVPFLEQFLLLAIPVSGCSCLGLAYDQWRAIRYG
jgi:hypothetical protein